MRSNRTSLIAVPVILAAIFGSTLIGIDRLAFRDVGHFYTPLYRYVSERTKEQWLPLWNPLDQAGMPLIGETTTAFFYPPRYILFSLPISTETAMAWYVVLHLLLAAWAASRCARWNGASPAGAGAAGIVYAFSGSVLFLYCNPPFLVGAAWLPLVLGLAISRFAIPFWTRAAGCGTGLAMMVLGGDPQTALHSVLVCVSVVIARGVLARRTAGPKRQRPEGRGQIPSGPKLRGPKLRGRQQSVVAAVLVAPIIAAVLSAPQIAASVSWSRLSERVVESDEDWTVAPRVGGRRHQAYRFSLPPWHCAEMVTPNAFGTLFPQNRRVSALIPGDGPMWTPTIYLGMLTAIALSLVVCAPLLGAIAMLRGAGRRRIRVRVWPTIAAAGLLFGFGHFGLVWIVQNVTGRLADHDSAIGGAYWILYQGMPGYDAFRYPVKWLPFFSIGSAMTLAQWIDRDWWRFRSRTKRVAAAILTTLVLAWFLVALLRWQPDRWIPNTLPSDRFWGPLDVAAGLAEIHWSLFHSTAIVALFLLLSRLEEKKRWRRKSVRSAAVALIAIDLLLAGAPLVAKVSRQQEARLIQLLPMIDSQNCSDRWMRTQSGGGWPGQWRSSSDRQRMLDVEASLRYAWFGRWHLEHREYVLNNMTSIQSRAMGAFWQATREAGREMSPEERSDLWHAVRQWSAIRGTVRSTGKAVEIPGDGRVAKMVEVGTRISPVSRFEFHSRWESIERTPPTVADFRERISALIAEQGYPVPLVDGEPVLPPDPGGMIPERIEVREMLPETLELEIVDSAAGLITRPVFQDGNWFAERSTEPGKWEPVEVRRVDHLWQGVLIPAGDCRVRFHYRPNWPRWSVPLGAIGWAVLLSGWVYLWRKRGSSRRNGQNEMNRPIGTKLAS